MEIRIEWSELSERQLKDIFDYYSLEVSPKIANNKKCNFADKSH
ncbi:MAG TPA: hypothetical protein VFC67_06260 [Prolixibacteraceae bacterium]|nr:hypothetical protein [Prolixibacteraceae bacterium]